MSSRFVSGGAIDAETGEATTAPAPPPARETAADLVVKKGEWLAVQKELEAERQQREAHRLATAAEPEKSLFEVLQANKEAKQAALDEAHKFKNQFRALDEDEIEFLDGVKAAQRAEEQRVRRETEQGLEAFRAAQKRSETEANAAEADDDDAAELEDSWLGPAGGGGGGGGRKRRRERERDKFKRVRRRESGSQQETQDGRREEHDAQTARPGKPGTSSGEGLEKGPAKGQNSKTPQEPVPAPAPGPAPVPVSKVKAGLVDYGSSDDDDD